MESPRNNLTDLFTPGTTSHGFPSIDWNRIPHSAVTIKVLSPSFTVFTYDSTPFSTTFYGETMNNPGSIAKKILELISIPDAETSFIHINIPLHRGYRYYLKEICREINSIASNVNFPNVYFINAEAYNFPPYECNHIHHDGFHGLKLTFGVSSKRPVQPK